MQNRVQNRIVAAAVATLVAAGLCACSSGSSGQASSSATVTINKNDIRIPHAKCGQQEWFRTIEIGDEHAGATVEIDEHAGSMTAKFVRIHNVGGFTGMWSQGAGEQAKASFSGTTYTVSGTADGSKSDDSTQPASADFKIVATC